LTTDIPFKGVRTTKVDISPIKSLDIKEYVKEKNSERITSQKPKNFLPVSETGLTETIGNPKSTSMGGDHF
jgi:hypothetical protein